MKNIEKCGGDFFSSNRIPDIEEIEYEIPTNIDENMAEQILETEDPELEPF